MVTMHGPWDLPEDVLVSILARLPADSVARSRAVCRAWRSAVSHPSFDRVHAERPAAVAKVTVKTDLADTTIVAFDFFRGRWHLYKTLPSPRTLRFTPCDHPSKITVLGSWDGIVCIQRRIWKPRPRYQDLGDQYTLWNPLTMACADASSPTNGGEIIGAYAHPSTRRFHLLHASCETAGDHPAIRILTVGDAMIWRDLPLDLEEDTLMIMKNTHVLDFVSLHGNLHWLVSSRPGSALRLLAFDMTHEKFRSMAAPEHRRGRAGRTVARLGVLPGGKLCIFDLEPSACAMDVWVLDDYGAVQQSSSWRLKERISLVMWDKTDLSHTFSKSKVGVVDGEEMFLHGEDGWIYAYNLADKEWRTANVSRSNYSTSVSLVMHRESVLSGKVSFGEALSPALSPTFHRSGPAKLLSLAVY